ncbi:MAG TPA: Crp/Fnr family transcriptional regulator [Terriglobales bacterium]|nr:Crp/Fnr family transcriptional regulator [Terriglobales bacterium]
MFQNPCLNQRSPDLWEELRALKITRKYPAGAAPFQFGQPVAGIYLVESGQVGLSLPRPSGQTLFEVAGPGCVLGLSEALSGEPYKLNAEAMVECELAFVDRDQLLHYLREHPEFCMNIVRQLSEDLHGLYYRYVCSTERASKSRRSSAPSRVN